MDLTVRFSLMLEIVASREGDATHLRERGKEEGRRRRKGERVERREGGREREEEGRRDNLMKLAQ